MLIFVCFSLVSSRHTPIGTNAPPRWMWRCRCHLKPPRWTSPPTVYNIPNVLQPSIPQTIYDYCTINPDTIIDRRPDLFPVNTNVTRSDNEETRLRAALSIRADLANQRTRNVSGNAVTARVGGREVWFQWLKPSRQAFKRLYTSPKSRITVRLGLVSFDRWNKPPRPHPVTRSCTHTHKRFKQLAPPLASKKKKLKTRFRSWNAITHNQKTNETVFMENIPTWRKLTMSYIHGCPRKFIREGHNKIKNQKIH